MNDAIEVLVQTDMPLHWHVGVMVGAICLAVTCSCTVAALKMHAHVSMRMLRNMLRNTR